MGNEMKKIKEDTLKTNKKQTKENTHNSKQKVHNKKTNGGKKEKKNRIEKRYDELRCGDVSFSWDNCDEPKRALRFELQCVVSGQTTCTVPIYVPPVDRVREREREKRPKKSLWAAGTGVSHHKHWRITHCEQNAGPH